jgi:hypothetical protein
MTGAGEPEGKITPWTAMAQKVNMESCKIKIAV